MSIRYIVPNKTPDEIVHFPGGVDKHVLKPTTLWFDGTAGCL